MKDAFENSFKENLDNFEMPYDSAAWNAMQSRLDATASTPSFEDTMKDGLNANQYPYNPAAWTALSSRLDKANKGGFKKWYVAAGIIGAAVITTAILWPNTSENETTSKQSAQKSTTSTVAKVTEAENNGKTQANGNNQNNANQKPASNDITAPTANGNSANTHLIAEDPNTQIQNGQPNNTSTQTNPQGNAHANVPQVMDPKDPSLGQGNDGAATEARTFILPAIPEKVCEGEAIQIENENDYAIVVVYPNGLNWVGRENQVTRLNPSTAGTYQVGFLRNNQFKKKAEFRVNEAPLAEFDFVDLSQKYLDGLPTIEVRSTSKASAYTWEYQNGTVRGEEVGLHFYEKGIHPVKMTVTDEHGCAATVEKTVNVDEDYNLLAMTAFFPNGNDRETNTFMPYALMQRDVNFTMIILDPNDGHVLFETSDADEGWNGIDQQTGAQAPMTKSYIWKVTVMNPEKGEKSNYTGTVLTLQQ